MQPDENTQSDGALAGIASLVAVAVVIVLLVALGTAVVALSISAAEWVWEALR